MHPRPLIAVVAALLLAGCSLEYRPPDGSAREREQIRSVVDSFHLQLTRDRDSFVTVVPPDAVFSWHSREGADAAELWQAVRNFTERLGGARLDTRALRMQIRQEGDLADAWVTSEWSLALSSGQRAVFNPRALFVLTREGGGWRLRSVRYDRDF